MVDLSPRWIGCCMLRRSSRDRLVAVVVVGGEADEMILWVWW